MWSVILVIGGCVVVVASLLALAMYFGTRQVEEMSKPKPPKPYVPRPDSFQIMQIARIISGGDSEVMQDIAMAIRDPSEYCAHYRVPCSPEDIAEKRYGDPLSVMFETLGRHNFVGSADWKAGYNEIQDALAPVLEKQQIRDFDWSFTETLEAANKYHDLKTQNVLAAIGEKLASSNKILVDIGEGSDCYFFAICNPSEFEQLRNIEHKPVSISRCSEMRESEEESDIPMDIRMRILAAQSREKSKRKPLAE